MNDKGPSNTVLLLEEHMSKFFKLITVALLSVSFLGGCASQFYHDYIMSGQIVTVDDKQVVVCVTEKTNPKAYTLHPNHKPSTLHTKPYTLNPTPLNPKL